MIALKDTNKNWNIEVMVGVIHILLNNVRKILIYKIPFKNYK